MRLFLFFLFFVLVLQVSSQQNNNILSYTFSDAPLIEFSDEYKREVKLFLEAYPEIIDTAEVERQWKEFFLSSGLVKNRKIEKYLNDILKTIVADSVIKKYNLRIYLTNELGINASCYENGMIYWNVYNFIYLKSEAEIAFILGHEVGHVFEQKGEEMTILYEKYKRSNPYALINFRRNRLEKTSQKNEHDADKIGCELLAKSPYKNSAALNIFNLFERVEYNNKFNKLSLGYSLSYLKTHPNDQARKDSLASMINSKGKDFYIDEELFHRIKNESTTYFLEVMLHYNLYYKCIELGLEQYLISKDKNVVYYVLESIRRVMYVDEKSNNLTLLNQRYSVGKLYNVLHNANKIFIRFDQCDSTLISDMKSTGMFSYQNYFDYFSKIAKSHDLKDCYLPLGLFDYEKSKSKEYLLKLVEYDNSYKNYVDYVFNPESVVSDFNKLQLIQTDIHFNKYNYYGFEVEQKYQEDTLIPVFNSYVKQKYNEIAPEKSSLIQTYELQENQFVKYHKFLGFYSFYWYLDEIKAKTKKFNQYILKPDLGRYMVENKIKKISFLDMFQCRDGQMVAKVLLSGNGVVPRFWTYSIDLYSSAISDGELKIKSYDVGVGTVTRNSVLGTLKYNILTTKNLN